MLLGMSSVLIIDDDRDARDALAQYLRRVGLKVDSAPNGREGLTSILERMPDLIVLDLRMPEMDGAGLLEVLRSYLRLQNVSVVVWTAVPDSPIMERAQALNVDAIMIKPKATLEEIGRMVLEQIEKRSAGYPPQLFPHQPDQGSSQHA
jgi:CheY-like chemotaxis protein